MDDETQAFLDAINAGIKEEIEKTWAAGRPITVGRDGKIIEIYPDGTEVVVKDTGILPIKPDKTEYKL